MEAASCLGLRVFGVRFLKVRGTFLGVLIIRTILFWGLKLDRIKE